MLHHAIEKAAVLIEAMPYIQAFRGETVVVKFGGSIINDEASYADILRDVAFMEIIGMRPVIVHGGGKAITRKMEEAGIAANFVKGLRVTDAETIAIVEKTLNEEVNPQVRKVLEGFNAPATGFRGQDVFRVSRHTETDPETGEVLDWGFVGNVDSADVSGIVAALNAGRVPVVTPLGRDKDGNIYNINADEAAGAMARELKARKLVFLSDVPGLMRDPSDPKTIISTLTLEEMERLIGDGTIAGGMLPKVSGAVKALKAGVRKTHIIDAEMPHSLLLELFTEQGVGTEIVGDFS
ncbi:MAG: acetylglutamate kinase [Verrucomicrobia bacterium]|nr:acetylglutamate kinase [Verrucomicrobiota bacterium]MCH8511758.1 acetylglutamate kinase [Kiritimatiellia bacterium]